MFEALLAALLLGSVWAYGTAPEPPGWYAGDMHVHRSCGGSPVPLQSIEDGMTAQNLAVVSLLADMGNGEVQDPVTDLPQVGGDASVSRPGRIVHWDAEWHWDATYSNYAHQALGGHIVALGLRQAQQIWEESSYPIFRWAHQQNAIAGFAHLQYLGQGFPQELDCCVPVEYPVEVALGSCDFLDEDVEGGDSAMSAYYRLLNCGLRVGFAGGTDYPCGSTTVLGSVLTYVQTRAPLSYRAWIEGIAAGRTVVSRNGHAEFLALSVNNRATPGDEIKLKGPGTVSVSVKWTAIRPLSGTVEIVCNGAVIASQDASVAENSCSTLNVRAEIARSGWLAARRMGSRGHEVQTGAVYVTVNDAPVRASVDDAAFYLRWMDDLLANTAPGGVWRTYFMVDAEAVRARYQAARDVFARIAAEAGANEPGMAATAGLLSGPVNVAYKNVALEDLENRLDHIERNQIRFKKKVLKLLLLEAISGVGIAALVSLKLLRLTGGLGGFADAAHRVPHCNDDPPASP